MATLRRTTDLATAAWLAVIAGCADPAPVDTDPLHASPRCTSGDVWTRGDVSSARMNPGMPCVSCHARTGASPFSVAGTVYATGHEPDLCSGSTTTTDDPIAVEVTDATGTTVTLAPNSAGNFYHRVALTPPYRVALRYQGRVRRMLTEPTSGDCNACHTAAGAEGAPGRVTLP